MKESLSAAIILYLCTILIGCGTPSGIKTGPQGPQGVAGAQGPQGAQGLPGTPGLIYRGVFSNGMPYAMNDAVTFDGSTYIATAANSAIRPTGDPGSVAVWNLLAKAGEIGPVGLSGTQGLAGLQGPVGPAGAQGPAGPQGPVGYLGSANVGTTSTDTTLYNVVFGALNSVPTGNQDTVYGVAAGRSLTTGREMTIIGAQACEAFSGSTDPNAGPENGLSTCIGSFAGANFTTGIDNVFIGQKAGLNGKNLANETIVGVHAGTGLQNGNGDVIVGSHTMDNDPVMTTNFNTVVGQFSFNAAGTKQNNVVLGAHAAGSLSNAENNIIIGSNGSHLINATASILIGNNVGNQGISTNSSVFIGDNTGYLTPDNTVSIGANAARYASVQGTFVGNAAGGNVTSGDSNTCIGASSCEQFSTGRLNTSVGAGSGSTGSGTDQLTVAVGAYAQLAEGASYAAQIGRGVNAVPSSFQFNNTQIVDGNGDIHTGTAAPAVNSTCSPGAVRIVGPYFYACVAQNQWMRAALSTY